MKKIIIRDFIEDSGLAVTIVSRCLKTAKKDLTDSLFVFFDKKIIVAVTKNKESLRFNVYEENKNQLFENPEQLD